MKNTKFTCVILITLLSINCLFGCGSQKQKPDFSSIKSVCELSTLKCYYHNVATYEKNAHGLLKVFGSGYKKIWIEYSGIVNLGIDINKVDISEPDTNNVITIKIPDAEVQSTSLDKSTLSATNWQRCFHQDNHRRKNRSSLFSTAKHERNSSKRYFTVSSGKRTCKTNSARIHQYSRWGI